MHLGLGVYFMYCYVPLRPCSAREVPGVSIRFLLANMNVHQSLK